jgi:hypothetical protein
MALSPTAMDLLYRAVQAEAGGESPEGMEAVAHVIMNRAAAEGFPGSVEDVILQPGQFSAFNQHTGYAKGRGGIKGVMGPNYHISPRVKAAVDSVVGGQSNDPTGGALNYANPATADKKNLRWINAMSNQTRIGNHLFGTAGGGGKSHGLRVPGQNPLSRPYRNTELAGRPSGRLAAAFGRSLPSSGAAALPASTGDPMKDRLAAENILRQRGMSEDKMNTAAPALASAFGPPTGGPPMPRAKPPLQGPPMAPMQGPPMLPQGAPRPRPMAPQQMGPVAPAPAARGMGGAPMPKARPAAPTNLLSALFGRMFG